jgi:8-oxo-dGTP diphosphatase
MAGTPPSNDPLAFQRWVNQVEQNWQAGLIPDPKAVAIILVNKHNEVLLQLRDNDPNISFPNSWTLPGGVVESHETPEQAAHRELDEETGLHLKLSHWKVYTRKPQNRQFLIEQHIYVGITDQTIDAMILGEGQALQFFRQDELSSLSIAFEFDRLLDEFFDQGTGTAR